MLREPFAAVAGANRADRVVHVQTSSMADVNAGQCRGREIDASGSKPLLDAGRRQGDRRTDCEQGAAVSVGPETNLCADLYVAEARRAVVAIARLEPAVERDARFEPPADAQADAGRRSRGA